MIMAGSAIAIAGDAVIEKGRSLMSHVLEVSKADLEFRDGSFVQGTDISIGLLDLAMRMPSLRDLPPDLPTTPRLDRRIRGARSSSSEWLSRLRSRDRS